MSTKTTLKRLALATVAVMGFGLLSVAPARAEATPTAIVVGLNTEDDSSALAASKYTASTILDPDGISAFSVVAGSEVELEIIPVGGASAATASVRLAYAGIGIFFTSAVIGGTVAGTGELLNFFTAPSVPGTYTINGIYDEDNDYDVVDDQRTFSVTMTVTAPTGFSATLSTALITSSPTAVATVDTDAVTASGSATAATANSGSIKMSFLNTAAGTMTTGNTVLAQITSGPGYLFIETADTPTAGQCGATPTFGATKGRAVVLAVDAVSSLIICADGTAGVATIALSVTNNLVTTAWTTKSFTFYGAVRTLAVTTSNFTIGSAGGDETGSDVAARTTAGNLLGALDDTTTAPAFIISAKDSVGQLATAAAAPAVISSDLTVVASGACVLDNGSSVASSGEGFGIYNCAFTTAATAVSGQTATLTFRINDPLGTAGIDYLTTTAVVTVGGARFTETISLDKSSYVAGEAMVVTRTAKDSAGNPVADGSGAPAVVFNKAIGGSAPGTGFYKNGTLATSSTVPAVFAPTASGVFEARMSGRNGSTTTVPIITTATVGESSTEAAANAAADAAAEAIDAANAATDAANLAAEAADAATVAAEEARDAADAATAAVEALATEVATLMAALKAQITTLANVVAKIAKRTKS